jgi:coiled-coil and C2 domain-containing protein 2A
MLSGSEIDHSLLLVNYFTSLGKRAFLVLGRGVPEGATAYVLTSEDNGSFWLWNSVSGERFGTQENFCPLTSVMAVLNEKNVWGNVQPAERPARIRQD